MAAVRGCFVDGGEVGADAIGFQYVELCEHRQGVLVVVAGAGGVAEGVVCPGEAGVGAGLLVTVAGSGGGGVGCDVVGESVAGVSGGVGGFADTVERPSFAVLVAGFAEDGQGLLMVVGGLGWLTQHRVERAESVQCLGFGGAVAELAGQGQGQPEVVGGRPVAVQP